MNGFLLDTNVVSMLFPTRDPGSQAFLEWLHRMDQDARLFLSVVTIHEIERGIALLDHKGATAKAAALKVWLTGLTSIYDDKIIGFDAISAALAGQLESKAVAAGHNPGMADAIIAGIAQAHDLHIITNNTKHFLPFGCPVSLPDDVRTLS